MQTIAERRRPRLFVVMTIFLALFVLSINIHAVTAKQSLAPKSVTIAVRGGSLEEGSPGESEDDDSTTSELTELATKLRLEGKEHHDSGDFVKAAEVFQQAADTLLDGDDDLKRSEDYATCRLHQALCHLKSENYDSCIEACSDVLEDEAFGPAITARAYHRRAKAKIGLGDNSGALQDARTASFLGDNKAVNLYGKLMRESSSSDMSGLMNPMMNSPMSSPHSALLESLMNKSPDSGPSGLPDFNPMSMLLGGGGGGGDLLSSLGSGGSGMAKSMVKNLVGKLDDESTRVRISDFMQNTNTAQLRNFAGMAGLDSVTDDQLAKIESFCHKVTPKTIGRTVGLTKVAVYLFKVIRRTMELVQKYKTLIVAIFIVMWTKSAILRPLPINKRALKKAAKQAAKQAAQEALKGASRAGFF